MKMRPDQLEEGMLLAKDVFDINYRLLVPKGERIAKQHIRVLKIWGIQEVEIAGVDEDLPDTLSLSPEEAFAAARATAKEIFKNVDLNHPAMTEIYRLSVNHRAKTPELEPDKILGKIKRPEKFASPIPDKLTMEEIKLPETPLMIAELNKVIDNPYSSASDIAAIVNQSTSLSALLLRIVNSVFYNFPEKIDSISWAVTLIGTKEVVNLAYGISIMEVFKDIPKEVINVQSFIRHSLFTGILSRILGAHKNMVRTEQLFVSGLLHDIGRLVMYKYYPEQSLALLAIKEKMGHSLYRVERKMGGYRHADLGYYLMKKWNLPDHLVEAIYHHHSPDRGGMKPAIVHMADIITTGLGVGSSGESYVPVFDEVAWQKLNLSTGLFDSAVRQALHQIKFLGFFNQG